MQVTGTKFIRSATPSKIEKLPDGRFRVHWRNANDPSSGSRYARLLFLPSFTGWR